MGERIDAFVEKGPPVGGDGGPVTSTGGASGWELLEGACDLVEGEADALGGEDEGDPTDGVASVAAVAGVGPLAGDEALVFVEAESRGGNAGATCDLADRESLGDDVGGEGS